MRSSSYPPFQQGYVLVAVLMLTVVVALMLIGTQQSATTSLRTSAAETRRTQAFLAAQSGLERVQARAHLLKSSLVVQSDLQAAQALASSLNGLSASLYRFPEQSGGRYVVEATALPGTASGAVLRLRSRGYSAGDLATRRLESRMIVQARVERPSVPFLANAPAALSITGNSSINGAAPIAGDIGGLGSSHTFSCPPELAVGASCVMSSTSPPRYRLRYRGSIPSSIKLGARLRPTTVQSGQVSEEIYAVESVNSATGEVSMLAVSNLIRNADHSLVARTFPATGDIVTRELLSVPALLAPPGVDFSSQSSNVSSVCTVYECGHYSITPDDLFRSVMGGGKDEIKASFERAGLLRTTSDAGCSPVVWMVPPAGLGTLHDCGEGHPQLVVVDARGMDSVDLAIAGSQATFRGLLYVLADRGDAFKVSGNNGFAGAMVVDTGDGGIDLRGTGNFNLTCEQDAGTSDDLKKTPKLCYSATTLAPLTEAYLNSGVFTAAARLRFDQSSWKEISDAFN